MSQEEKISWFHGKISRQQAEEILRNAGNEEGQFLVRESSTALGDYVVSLKQQDGEVIHYQIRRHGEDAFFSIDEGPIIHGLEMLIEYYRQEPDGLSTQLGQMCRGQPPPSDCRIHGRTNLLHRATREGNLKVVTELLKSGYRGLDAKNLDGQTALHVSSMLGHDDILLALLDAGANVGVRDCHGLTPLHYACQLDRATTVRILIDRGNANMQARASRNGWVAIHEAASRGFSNCVKVLLVCNAPCCPRTDDGSTPYDLATRNSHYECARLLENYKASVPKTSSTLWFHGNITRQDAYNLLEMNGFQDGAYLVRQSSQKPGVHVLTMVNQKQFFNFEIQKKGKYHFIDDGPYLESLEHVIYYYSHQSDGLPALLLHPIAQEPKRNQWSLSVINPACYEATDKKSSTCELPEKEFNENITPTLVEYIRKESLELAETIGVGEFGSVLKGFWNQPRGDKVEVATKFLRNEHLKQARDGFLREATVMIDLNHPCIVKLHGICLGPPLMMVQELVSLGSVLDCLLDYPDQVKPDTHLPLWAAQISLGMIYLEERRFVHRDLAARNILLASMEQAKISDFGLSRALGVGSEYYKASHGGRWPVKWYAPESINFGTFSHSSDVWSYGITLWEMYSFGQTPYEDKSGAQVIELLEKKQRLSRPVVCPLPVYRLMLHCWAYSPKDRPNFYRLNVCFSNPINLQEEMQTESHLIVKGTDQDQGHTSTSSSTSDAHVLGLSSSSSFCGVIEEDSDATKITKIETV